MNIKKATIDGKPITMERLYRLVPWAKQADNRKHTSSTHTLIYTTVIFGSSIFIEYTASMVGYKAIIEAQEIGLEKIAIHAINEKIGEDHLNYLIAVAMSKNS